MGKLSHTFGSPFLRILLGGKPSNSFLVPEDGQRLATSDDHVESQVELQTIKQVRLVNVALHDMRRC